MPSDLASFFVSYEPAAQIVIATRKRFALTVSAPCFKAFMKGGEYMDVKNIPIEQIKPYEKNAKKHPDEQVEQIANSLKEFGWQQPIVLDKNNVVVIGHGRLMAAQKLGMTEAPVVYAEGLTQKQIKALRLADNKVSESGWDFDLLGDELDDLFDFDMGQFGFSVNAEGDENDQTGGGGVGFNYKSQYGVIVMCDGEADQEEIYNRLTGEGYSCKVVVV